MGGGALLSRCVPLEAFQKSLKKKSKQKRNDFTALEQLKLDLTRKPSIFFIVELPEANKSCK